MAAGWSKGLDFIFFVGLSAENMPDLPAIAGSVDFLRGESDGSLAFAPPLGDLTMSSRSTRLPWFVI